MFLNTEHWNIVQSLESKSEVNIRRYFSSSNMAFIFIFITETSNYASSELM